MLFAFTLTTVTKILLHITIFFTIIKSLIQCCGKNRKVAGVDSRRTSRRMQDSYAPKSSQAVTPRRMSTPATPRQRDSLKPGIGKKTQPSSDDDKKQEFLPYPEVAEPTPSAKQRHKDELEREKRQKIAEGFYQEKSDQDDTLEKVASLKMEPSESTKRAASAKRSFRQRRLNDESLHQRVPATARLAVT
ncbi:unnamed protein product [Cylicocyclus nassatus]|uniref:Uncharacterized protein n=1 Tax=Cylicocyclus nassatus TaxID=53992 RepID=A0AA36M881_CYLNA|nr:unnamed protein product [Cylicocyclus nassatus]